MKNQKPILFSAPMVQAIFNGTKTMTRRAVTARSAEMVALMVNLNAGIRGEESKDELIRCCNPFGELGDILWVRENFAFETKFNSIKPSLVPYSANVFFVADGLPNYVKRKRPSIHMPKERARIWLEITDIKVERLHDISEIDAVAEGVQSSSSYFNGTTLYKDYLQEEVSYAFDTAVESYTSLWCSINGRDDYDANPWVWAISFKEVSTTGKPEEATA